MVRDTNWQVRLRAAGVLAENPGIPAPRKAELLLDALQQEINSPAPLPSPAGSYLPLTGVIRLHYVHLIEDLGANASAPARAAISRQTGLAREWASIAWGASGAQDAAAPLRELLRTSRDPEIRMAAAYFLGQLGDRSAVGDLKQALSDQATAQVKSDAGEPPRSLYPVREQAAGALGTLGLEVERNGNTFTAK